MLSATNFMVSWLVVKSIRRGSIFSFSICYSLSRQADQTPFLRTGVGGCLQGARFPCVVGLPLFPVLFISMPVPDPTPVLVIKTLQWKDLILVSFWWFECWDRREMIVIFRVHFSSSLLCRNYIDIMLNEPTFLIVVLLVIGMMISKLEDHLWALLCITHVQVVYTVL